jgi:hypothetical protein
MVNEFIFNEHSKNGLNSAELHCVPLNNVLFNDVDCWDVILGLDSRGLELASHGLSYILVY